MASGQPEGRNISRFEISQLDHQTMEEGLGTTLLRATHEMGVGCELTNKETMHNLQKEAFQLANYYFVFQGVIFTAFYSAPSNSKCKYRWVPFTLSFLAGILNLFALLSMALKYKKLLDDKDCRAAILELEDGPPGMRVSPAATERRSGKANSPAPIMVRCLGNWRMLYVMGCMVVFAGFFVSLDA